MQAASDVLLMMQGGPDLLEVELPFLDWKDEPVVLQVIRFEYESSTHVLDGSLLRRLQAQQPQQSLEGGTAGVIGSQAIWKVLCLEQRGCSAC